MSSKLKSKKTGSSEKGSKTATMLKKLKSEHINTWFDLGLFIDKVRDTPPKAKFAGDYEAFSKHLNTGSIGMLSFYFTIDGITIEADKYAKILKRIYPAAKMHFIAGEIHPEVADLLDTSYKKVIKEMDGFNNWPLYDKFFNEKLERGSDTYNQLIGEFWEEVLVLVEKLGSYIEKQNINLLYIINICSNPGNVSLALATVLISEYLAIPVINNSHDFYWEGGNRKSKLKKGSVKKGPRDFFFTNSHVGEFFSIIEVLYPWERKSWMTVNINRHQYNRSIQVNGHNPANVAQIGTAIDYKSHLNISKRDIIGAFMQVASIFANNKKSITVHTAAKHINSIRSLRPILYGYKKNYQVRFS